MMIIVAEAFQAFIARRWDGAGTVMRVSFIGQSVLSVCYRHTELHSRIEQNSFLLSVCVTSEPNPRPRPAFKPTSAS